MAQKNLEWLIKNYKHFFVCIGNGRRSYANSIKVDYQRWSRGHKARARAKDTKKSEAKAN